MLVSVDPLLVLAIYSVFTVFNEKKMVEKFLWLSINPLIALLPRHINFVTIS